MKAGIKRLIDFLVSWLGKTPAMAVFLNNVLGRKAEIISTGCCGMGGSFCYRHSVLSQKIFQGNARLPEGAAPLLVSGTSCRHQFRDLSETRPLHLEF